MARIRTIKEDFFQNERMASCSAHAQLLAIGLLPQCDDEGYFEAHPKLIKARVFPFSEDSLNIPELLNELSQIGYLQLYEDSLKKQYGHIPGFLRHQKVNRPTPSKIKGVLESQGKLIEDSVSNHGGLTLGKEGKGKEEEGKGKEEPEASASPPPPLSFPISKEHEETAKQHKLNLPDQIQAYVKSCDSKNKFPSSFGLLKWLEIEGKKPKQPEKPKPLSDKERQIMLLKGNIEGTKKAIEYYKSINSSYSVERNKALLIEQENELMQLEQSGVAA